MHRLVYVGLCALILCALLATGSAAAPAAADLSITSVEVTQAIQRPANNIRLIAQRSTAVRATIGVTGNAGVPVAGVTGRLHVFRNGVEVTPVAGVPATNEPFTAPVLPQRANENDTLNFELLAPTGIAASTDVDFRVDITPLAGETDTANNSRAANDLTVVAGFVPSLFFTRINWVGTGLPSLTFAQAGQGDAFVRGIIPVNDGDPSLYRQGLFPTLNYNQDPNGNGIIDEGAEVTALLSFLASCRQLIVDNGLGANATTFLFGWVLGNPIDGNGWAQNPGNNAFGNTDPVRGQRTYAHELIHNLTGLDHNTRFLDEVGWDVGGRLPNNPAGNNVTGRVKPTTLRDIMVGGQVTNQAWIDTVTHGTLLANAALGLGGPDAPDDIDDIRKRSSRLVLVIQGAFDARGRRLISLEPVFRFPWLSQPSTRQRQAQVRYVAEVVTAAGSVIRTAFTPGVHDDGRGRVEFGFFEVMVPVRGEVASVRITDRAGERTFGRIVRSQARPTIRILTPLEKARLGRRTRVRWAVGDSDTPLPMLRYQVAYSADGGRSWVPIGVDLQKTAFAFDSTQIQRSRANGVLRVFVSDGLNTAFDDVTGLTPTRARFPAP